MHIVFSSQNLIRDHQIVWRFATACDLTPRRLGSSVFSSTDHADFAIMLSPTRDPMSLMENYYGVRLLRTIRGRPGIRKPAATGALPGVWDSSWVERH